MSIWTKYGRKFSKWAKKQDVKDDLADVLKAAIDSRQPEIVAILLRRGYLRQEDAVALAKEIAKWLKKLIDKNLK